MKVELNEKHFSDTGNLGNGLLITPPINEDYWKYRVKLSENQAIVGFPKFCTIGIGFQKEEDWNANLPYSCDAEEIFNHIAHNKQDKNISDSDCITAITMLQNAIRENEKPVPIRK